MDKHDIIIWGASGFTGRLIAEALAARDAGRSVALAGRDAARVEQARDQAGLTGAPILTGDAADPGSMAELAAQGRVVISAVGPYQLYGGPLVAACAEAGTDYVDLCGEPPFMWGTIAAHDARARETGARIVHSCGFDSVPFDMGVHFLQGQAVARTGAPLKNVACRVRSMRGEFSGGTAASGRATMAAAMKDPAVLQQLMDPFALCEGDAGAKQPHGGKPYQDEALGTWVAPFFMAPINTKNVHRSHYLNGRPWGADFTYEEMMATGPGEAGQQTALALAKANPMADANGPKPGEGPSREKRDAGSYDLMFTGLTASGERLTAGVKGDRDPGYGSTSKIIAECALALLDGDAREAGGVMTPAAAFGDPLIPRLARHAGLKFEIEDA